MEASKWLQIQALIEVSEMEALLDVLGEIRIFLVGQVTDNAEFSKEIFLTHYSRYISELKSGKIPDAGEYRKLFSCVFTLDKDHLLTVTLRENKRIVKVVRPVVQLQLHTMHYSNAEKKFRPMVFGQDSIHWGVAFSYPQLYLDPSTRVVEKVLEGNHFPNTILFRTLQKWIRKHTIPTPFVIERERINIPIRLGKECLPWINTHPQLKERGFYIERKGVKP